MALRVETIKTAAGATEYRLSGNIDERTRPVEELKAISGDGVLNLSAIDRVNSVGLVGWLRWISEASKTHQLSVEALSYNLATLANQISDLFGAAPVRSTLAPYFCPKCGNNHELLVTREEVLASPSGPPAKSCPACRGALDFDEMDDYFVFLREG